MVNPSQTRPRRRQVMPAKRTTIGIRDRLPSDHYGEMKPASELRLMLRCTPGAQRAEHHRNQQKPSTANNQRQQHSNHCATGIGFVGTRQSNAVKDDFPNSGDESATKRNDKERVSRSLGKANHSKRSFKCLFRSACDHQADMKNRRANKCSDDDKDGRQNQEQNPSEPADKMGKSAMSLAKRRK